LECRRLTSVILQGVPDRRDDATAIVRLQDADPLGTVQGGSRRAEWEACGDTYLEERPVRGFRLRRDESSRARRADIEPTPAPTSPAVPTLYDWAGGDEALRRLLDCFYDRVEADELLTVFFPGGVSEKHRDHVAAWWSEVFGGPHRYSRELGGYERMLAHHRNLDITDEQRHRFVATMSLAADDARLPSDPEFRSALLAYVEWGTRLAMHNSRSGAQDVTEHAPVPRWGWGVAPPYQP
jgi:hemoglobin